MTPRCTSQPNREENELAGPQPAFRVRECRLADHRSGERVDFVVEESQLAVLDVVLLSLATAVTSSGRARHLALHRREVLRQHGKANEHGLI